MSQAKMRKVPSAQVFELEAHTSAVSNVLRFSSEAMFCLFCLKMKSPPKIQNAILLLETDLVKKPHETQKSQCKFQHFCRFCSSSVSRWYRSASSFSSLSFRMLSCRIAYHKMLHFWWILCTAVPFQRPPNFKTPGKEETVEQTLKHLRWIQLKLRP